jgi:hypothetical protein
VLVHASVPTVKRLLDQAHQFGMTRDTYHYMFMNVDVHTMDMSAYRRAGCNITTVRLVDERMAAPLINRLNTFIAANPGAGGGPFVMPAVSVPVCACASFVSTR